MPAEQLYIKPVSVEEASALAHRYRDSFSFLAGGTDLVVNKFQGNGKSDCLIDLTGIQEMKSVSKENGVLKIGSLICLDDLKNYPEIKDEFPVLIEAANSVASPVLRKTATLGGNILCENRCIFYNQSEWWREAVGYCLKCEGDICIATGGKKACFSKFVSDTAPALISMDAQIEVAEKNETKTFKLEKIFTGDGVEPRNLKKGTIIKSILLPLSQGYRCSFKKLRQRESLDFTSLTSCVSLNKNGKIKIVLAGIDPKPVVVECHINDDKKSAIKQTVKKSRIVDNDVFSRKYRKEMIKVFLERSFNELF